uniref:hypothetical protein n=1 Tax=Agathobacter sp. TaxID=2021311 RepID=UPI004055CF83
MNISFLKEKGSKYLIWILVGLLILIMAIPTNTQENESVSANVQERNSSMEAQLEYVLSAMEGVGNVRVMITTENTDSALFGNENSQGTVTGVVVVAQGAGNPVVDARISDAVKALFSIDLHKISIVKMTKQEEEE